MTRQGKNTLLEIAIGGAFWALIIAAVVTRGAVFYPAFYKDPAGYLKQQAEETAKEQAKLAGEAAEEAAKQKQIDYKLFQQAMEEAREECRKDMWGYTTFEQCVAETYVQNPPDDEPDGD
jgi:guanylate kinase